MKKFLLGAVAAAGLAFASQAGAATYVLTDDHCTGTCGGLSNYGTITVSGTTTLDIVIDLASNVFFNPNGNGLDTVAWDLVNNPLISTSLPSGWAVNGVQSPGSNHEDGFGDFDYMINITNGSTSTHHLEFFVTGSGVNAGNTLTLDHNVADNQNIFFSVDVIGSNGKTGVIGATACTENCGVIIQGGVPEPATWAMMLVGFGGMGALLRQRRRQAAAATA